MSPDQGTGLASGHPEEVQVAGARNHAAKPATHEPARQRQDRPRQPDAERPGSAAALVLGLQSTAGNAAVSGVFAVQRKTAAHGAGHSAGHSAGRKGHKAAEPPTDAEVNAAGEAISAVPPVLGVFHNMVAEYQTPDIPPSLPPQYANML